MNDVLRDQQNPPLQTHGREAAIGAALLLANELWSDEDQIEVVCDGEKLEIDAILRQLSGQ